MVAEVANIVSKFATTIYTSVLATIDNFQMFGCREMKKLLLYSNTLENGMKTETISTLRYVDCCFPTTVITTIWSQYARIFSTNNKYSNLTSNIAESLNAAITEKIANDTSTKLTKKYEQILKNNYFYSALRYLCDYFNIYVLTISISCNHGRRICKQGCVHVYIIATFATFVVLMKLQKYTLYSSLK